MRNAQISMGVLALGALASVPFLTLAFAEGPGAGVESFLDAAIYLCTGAHFSSSSAADGWGGALDHGSSPGVYMPMFSKPPAGGAVYNGPPLDDC
jgi:hypothetical protein